MQEVQSSELKRGLSARHIRFIALGSAIGTGLFYGSAKAIQAAGPSVLIAYLIAGAAVYMVMRALGEMAVHNPVAGSFGQYASQSLGPLAGFITGWTYTFEMIIVCLADVTAFGLYMGFWYPDVPQWIWVLAIVLLIGGLNLCTVKLFGELEFWLSLLKVAAIVAMIAGGLGIMLFGIGLSADAPATGVHNLWQHGGFMPNGIGGLIASLAVVVFAFGGIEIIGITAGEARTRRTIPRAINAVPLRILLFYVLTLFVLMAIFPGRRSAARAALRADLRPAGHPVRRHHPEHRGDIGRRLCHQQRHLRRRPHALRHGAAGPGAAASPPCAAACRG